MIDSENSSANAQYVVIKAEDNGVSIIGAKRSRSPF